MTHDRLNHPERPDPERILITGYGGFVAPYLVAACAQRYPAARLFGLVHAPSQPPRAVGQPDVAPLPAVTEVAGDITDGARLRTVLRETRPDLIFHLAAASSVAASWRDPAEALRVNAGGFIHLAEAIRAEELTPRLLVSGSGEQYGLVRPEENPVTEETLPRPANPYAVAKVAQDLAAYQYYRAYGLDVVRARAFNHFGPGQSPTFVIASFAQQIAQIEAGIEAGIEDGIEAGQAEPTLLVGNLSAECDFLPVGEVIAAYLALAAQGQAGEAYNIGSGVARSIESVLQRLLALSTVRVAVRVDPARFRAVDVPRLCADITKIQRDTDWRPAAARDDALDAALRATLDYWRRVAQAPLT